MTTGATPQLHDFLDDDTAPPQVLWHYTDGAGLKGILEARKFWATEATFSNDAAEIHHGLGVWLDTVDGYVYTGKEAKAALRVDEMREVAHRATASFGARRLRLFLVCFCADGDVLSQWRAYGGSNTAGGYALGFASPESSSGVQLRRVVYDREAQRRASTALVDALVRLADESIGNRGRHLRLLSRTMWSALDSATTSRTPRSPKSASGVWCSCAATASGWMSGTGSRAGCSCRMSRSRPPGWSR
jgi:hypothetical protein